MNPAKLVLGAHPAAGEGTGRKCQQSADSSAALGEVSQRRDQPGPLDRHLGYRTKAFLGTLGTAAV